MTCLCMRAPDSGENTDSKICDINKSGKNYVLAKERKGERINIVLTDENKQEVIRFDLDEVFSRYRGYAVDKSEISYEEAAFTAENDRAKLTLVVQNAGHRQLA